MKSYKKTSDLVIEKRLKEREINSTFSHVISLAKKRQSEKSKEELQQKYKNVWYLKDVESTSIAIHEVMASEFFRLLIPTHPKCRLVKNNVGHAYILSKHVPGFIPFNAISSSTACMLLPLFNHIFSSTMKSIMDPTSSTPKS